MTCSKDEKSSKRWLGRIGAGAAGSLGPSLLYSAVGLGAQGPIAGGAFAAAQAAGGVVAGGWWATL